MTKREKLMEQYEDAMFALLMDEVAVSEGQKAIEENRRLRDSGELEIPDSVRQHCFRAIAKKTSENDLKQLGHGFTRVITKVAVAALVALLLFTTAFAASEDFRLKTLNFVMETFSDRTELRLVPDEADSAPELTVGWLPEGFELTDEGATDFSAWKEYTLAGLDETVYIYVTDLSVGKGNFDTETAEKIFTKVAGTNAFYIDEGSMVQVVWGYDSNSKWIYSVVGTYVDLETVLHVAENVAVSE